MKLLPRRGGSDADESAGGQTSDGVTVTAVEDADEGVSLGRSSVPKGRPTPKRRDAGGGARGPVKPAPRTRKEALAWQKEQNARAKTSSGPAAPAMSREAHREALRRGDPSVLPRRDQGPLKQLARDYVDSRAMISNWLLVAFVPLILGPFVGAGSPAVGQGLQFATLAILLVVLIEWYYTGTKLRKVARERDIPLSGSALGLGFYAGSRAYLPRRWRLPSPRKARGDQL